MCERDDLIIHLENLRGSLSKVTHDFPNTHDSSNNHAYSQTWWWIFNIIGEKFHNVRLATGNLLIERIT